jgi:hypothetical protein
MNYKIIEQIAINNAEIDFGGGFQNRMLIWKLPSDSGIIKLQLEHCYQE